MKIIVKFDSADEAADTVRSLGIVSLSLTPEQAARAFGAKATPPAAAAPAPAPTIGTRVVAPAIEPGNPRRRGDVERATLEVVRRNPGIESTGVAALLRTAPRAAAATLSTLHASGRVTRIGRGSRAEPYRYTVAAPATQQESLL